MKTAGYHSEGYGPGRSVYIVGDAGTTGPEGFLYVRKVRGVYVVAKDANRGACPDELLGCAVPCRIVLADDDVENDSENERVRAGLPIR